MNEILETFGQVICHGYTIFYSHFSSVKLTLNYIFRKIIYLFVIPCIYIIDNISHVMLCHMIFSKNIFHDEKKNEVSF